MRTMALSLFPELAVSTSAFLVLLAFCIYTKSRSSKNPLIPTDWPIVGILPSLVVNLSRFHDYISDILASSGHNFKSCLTGMRFLITCDPTNIRHIFTSNHANYLKGEEFSEMFDVTDGSFFTVDGEPCRRQRARIQSIFSSPQLLSLMAECCRDKVEKGVTPFLARMATMGAPFDMHDLMTRFAFDVTATPIFGVDPGLLSTGGGGADMPPPPMHAADAMDTVMEVGLLRHALPMCCWKAMRWLNVGSERKLAVAHKVLRGFVAEMIERRKLMTSSYTDDQRSAAGPMDILMSTYINDPEYSDDLLCATLINFMIAGRDTIGTALVWLFYNLAQNPDVVTCIRKELSPIALRKAAATNCSTMVTFEPDEMKPLVYLHATLYESLRLFPPIPIERKTVVADDVLPSGHAVCAGDTILVSLYSMGRMKDVWGEDCMEYRPERWLSGKGDELRYVPSHKFLAFNSGPRMCLGKDIAIMQMKTAVAAIAWNFDLEALKGNSVQPKFSCILQIKNGLMVKVKKREI